MFRDVTNAAIQQATGENRHLHLAAFATFAALTLITCVVLAILTMTETVSLTSGSGVLFGGGVVMLLFGSCYAHFALKRGTVPWEKVAALVLSTFLTFGPAVVCGGLTLGGVLDSHLLMGGLFLGPVALNGIIQHIGKRCQSSPSQPQAQ